MNVGLSRQFVHEGSAAMDFGVMVAAGSASAAMGIFDNGTTQRSRGAAETVVCS